MKNLYLGIQRFIRDEEGVTAIEYALIASLIAVVIIVAVRAVGTDVNATFQYIADQLNPPASGSGSGT
jgi:pilus assembly protein Flp/PilA